MKYRALSEDAICSIETDREDIKVVFESNGYEFDKPMGKMMLTTENKKKVTLDIEILTKLLRILQGCNAKAITFYVEDDKPIIIKFKDASYNEGGVCYIAPRIDIE